jgi:hypothetical protein
MAVQHRAEEVFLDVGGILQPVMIGLGHLADFFVQGHPAEHFAGLRIEGRETHHSG